MANVFPLDVVSPGAFGLNTEKSSTLLSPQWAVTAQNAVVNSSGRLAARLGWTNQTTTGITGSHTIVRLHEYINSSGDSEIISTANNVIYKNITDFSDVGNDITSTSTPTADYWQFVNFNNKVIGVQTGHNPIQRTTGDFADITIDSTGQPATPDPGNCQLAAFGRWWFADEDLQTIWYSSLLDEADLTTASGAGYIDMTSVWTNGMDEIVALAAIGGNLVVFGKNHIVMWSDGVGSEIGIDPTELQVVDTIEGTGCIARDSVAMTGEGDILFLSRHGLQSLGRVIQAKANPTVVLSKHIRSNMLNAIARTRATSGLEDCQDVVATHSPENGMYIINFPTLNVQYVFDTEHAFQDEDGDVMFPVTTWQLGGNIQALLSLVDGKLYFGSAGVVGRYQDYVDNSSSFSFEFLSGWLDFGDPQVNHRIKMLKQIIASVAVGSATATYQWEFDFNATQLTRAYEYTGSAVAEFGIAEFSDGGGAGIGYNDPAVGSASGETEFSGSVVVQRVTLPAHGEGQFLRLGVTVPVSGSPFSIQHMSIAPKLGRMVT